MDEVLRGLERSALDLPGDRLRLAAALERAGRADDVFGALVPALGDPTVRAAVAKLPAWTHPERGNAGGSRWLAVRPVRRAPRVRWRTRTNNGYGLIATAFGVVVAETVDPNPDLAEAPVRLAALDPDTGERRWHVDLEDVWQDAHGVARENVIVAVQQNKPSFVCDLLTGERLFDLAGVVAEVDRDLLLIREGPSRFLAVGWPAPGSPPLARARWEVDGVQALVSGGELVLGRADGAIRAVDRSTAAVLWEIPTAVSWSKAPLLDADGALVHSVTLHEEERPYRRQQHHLRSVTPSGIVLFEIPGFIPDVLTPTHYVLAGTKGGAAGELIDVHNRGSGLRVAQLETDGWAYGTLPIAAARDVIYLQIGSHREERRGIAVGGVAMDGTVLWRSALDVDDAIEVVAYPGRVYVLASDGTVLCLEESPDA